MKKIVSIIILEMFLWSSHVIASTEISIYVDEQEVILTEMALIKNDCTLILSEDIERILGIVIDWDRQTGVIDICRNSRDLLVPNNLIVYTMQEGERKVVIGVESKEIEVSPTVVNGKLYLPIRAVTELLGGTVEWYGGFSTVAIDTETERNLFGDRLKIKLPIQSCCEECVSEKQLQDGSYDTWIVVHDIDENCNVDLTIIDLTMRSVGDIGQAAVNLGYTPESDMVYKNGGIEILCVYSDKPSYENSIFLLKSSDESLFEIYVDANAEDMTCANAEIYFNTIWKDLICQITSGSNNVYSETKIGMFYDCIFEVPEQYTVYNEWGESGNVLIIEEQKISNNKNTARLIIGYKFGVSTGDFVVRKVESEFLGQNITWNCYANGTAEITKSGIGWIRIENSDETQTNQFIKIVESAERTEANMGQFLIP